MVLSGPRRVGKSVILKQLARELVASGVPAKSILYLSLDLPVLKLQTLDRLLDLYHTTIHPEGQPAYLLLDEVHYAADWDGHLKGLVDHHPEYRILATGSASLETSKGVTDAGVGRWTTVPIPTLSFYEFVHLRGERLPTGVPSGGVTRLFSMSRADLIGLAAAFKHLMPVFDRYLLVGGFPETASLDDVNACQRLLREDIVERVLKRDMSTIFGVRNVADVERLFIYLCYHSGAPFNVARCASQLSVSRQTIDSHLDMLVRANLLYRLSADKEAGKKALKVNHKYYVVDAALRNAVLLRGEEMLRDSTEMGQVVETAVLRHVMAYYYALSPRISYWVDPVTRREVDIVGRWPSDVVPIEVKYRESPIVDQKDGLAAFLAEEQGRVNRAYVVTRFERDLEVRRLGAHPVPCLFVPAHIFTYLIGNTEQSATERKRP